MKFSNVNFTECSFRTLGMGVVFECKGDIYMRTRTFHMDDGYEDCDINCVRLRDGEVDFFPNDEIVIERDDLCLTSRDAEEE